jgi:type I restriction enzyme S subunit
MSNELPPRWSYKKLDELGYVGRGRSRHRPRNDPSLYGGPYPFIQTAEITASDLYVANYTQTYSELGLAQSKMWDGNTLCIVNAGVNTGDSAILQFKACFPDSVIAFLADPNKADVRFVKYHLDTIKPRIRQITRGATQDNLSVTKLLSFEIPTPPLPTQRKIAAILSAYDDLIENNTRRIAILEEMAQLLYREWFVHFRFPGHESVQMVDADELRSVPEGWKMTAVSDMADVFRGRSYRSADLVEEGGLPFLNLKCVGRDGGFRHDGLKRYAGSYKDTQKARPGDIIIAVTDMTQERRIVARAARVPDIGEESFVFSMDLVKVVPRQELPSDYLYGMLRFSRFPDEIKQYATGVNVLHLRPDNIADFKFVLPPIELMERYASLVSVIYSQCDVLQKKTELLRRSRDLLLPRLISGRLDVSDLKILTGEFGQ